MEMQTNQNLVQTKEKTTALTASELAEFHAYKRNKRLAELSSAIARSVAVVGRGEDMQRVCERAVRLKQASVKIPITKLTQATYYLNGSGVKTDCVIGGDGETVSKVKAFEAKLASKRGAQEVTLVLAPSLLDCCRYGEIRREVKRVKRQLGKTALKVRVGRAGSLTSLGRVARIASEAGATFFSIPYFEGCERLRLDLTNGCSLEVTGVEKTEQFQALSRLGVGRIATSSAWEIYNDWAREASNPPKLSQEEKKTEDKSVVNGEESAKKEVAQEGETKEKKHNPETDYRCRLEGSDLKFL